TGGERPAPAGGGGMAPGAPLTALGALLAAQEVPEVGGGGGRRRAARRGHDLLDRLDELRLALLEGGVPEPTLRRIVALLEERAGPVDDPRLGAVLHEIEVRAAVELAKLERS
ncbi:MAG TPA: flagellar assembly protein FliX, partial [Geminicoccaceae bacterium]|nr:flagellar assembly protein FliX [Geminicoccaceae bacterium]